MNEQDYQNDLLHAEDGVDEPKAAGDKCTSPGCNINQSLRSYFCPTMEIGAIVDHPDGYKVKIIDGCYLDPTYGRVSNWWTWKQVKQDGSLGKKASGYGW